MNLKKLLFMNVRDVFDFSLDKIVVETTEGNEGYLIKLMRNGKDEPALFSSPLIQKTIDYHISALESIGWSGPKKYKTIVRHDVYTLFGYVIDRGVKVTGSINYED